MGLEMSREAGVVVSATAIDQGVAPMRFPEMINTVHSGFLALPGAAPNGPMFRSCGLVSQ